MRGRKIAAALAVFSGAALACVIGFLVWQLGGTGYETAETVAEALETGQIEAAAQEETLSQAPEGGGEETEAVRIKTEPEDETVRLVFAGDVLLSDHVLNAYERAGGDITGVVDQALLDQAAAGDLFIVNQEFPFSSRGQAAPDKQFTFRLPPERVGILSQMGIDWVTLANNHALDYGEEALVDTLDTLDQAGIVHVGAGRNLEEAKAPAKAEIKGKRIGLIGATRVIPETSWNASSGKPGMLVTYDPAMTLEAIGRLKESCDFVAVYVHWGIERDERPQEYQRAMGKQYIDAGADLVIGSHPHVLQGIEYYKGKPIVYSLGNFVFGSSIPRTALLTVEWDGEETRLSMTPAVSSGGYTRMVTDPAEREAFYRYMTEISFGVTVDETGCYETGE